MAGAIHAGEDIRDCMQREKIRKSLRGGPLSFGGTTNETVSFPNGSIGNLIGLILGADRSPIESFEDDNVKISKLIGPR